MRIRSTFTTGVFLASALAASSACTTKTSDPYPDVSTFCTAVAKAECQVATTCAIDETACETVRSSVCTAHAAAAMVAGVRKYTEANVQGCLDALNGAYGNGATSVPFAHLSGKGSITDACERVFAGSAATLASCTNQYDCAGGDLCVLPPLATAGLICAPEVDVAVGGLCGNAGDTCKDSYCVQQANGLQCVAAAQTGEPCSTTAPIVACVDTARCKSGTTAANLAGDVCVERATIGEPCTTNDDCSTSAPYCDTNAGSICTVGLTFATHAPDCAPFESATAVVDSGVTVNATDSAAAAD